MAIESNVKINVTADTANARRAIDGLAASTKAAGTGFSALTNETARSMGAFDRALGGLKSFNSSMGLIMGSFAKLTGSIALVDFALKEMLGVDLQKGLSKAVEGFKDWVTNAQSLAPALRDVQKELKRSMQMVGDLLDAYKQLDEAAAKFTNVNDEELAVAVEAPTGLLNANYGIGNVLEEGVPTQAQTLQNVKETTGAYQAATRRRERRERKGRTRGGYTLGGAAGFTDAGTLGEGTSRRTFEAVGAGDADNDNAFNPVYGIPIYKGSTNELDESIRDQVLLGNGIRGKTGAEKASDFMKKLADDTTAAGTAFQAFSGGVAAAIDAAITGSESMGKAFARASAKMLRAKAVEFGVQAIGEGAYALASLGFGDARGAATHGLAAAKFAAAAAAAGLGSAALGSMASAGGGSAGVGGAGGGFVRPQGGRQEDRAVNITINVGEGFTDPKRVGEEVSKALKASQRAGRSRDDHTLTYSVE